MCQESSGGGGVYFFWPPASEATISVSPCRFHNGEYFHFGLGNEGWVLCVGAGHSSLGCTPSSMRQNHYFRFTAGLHFRSCRCCHHHPIDAILFVWHSDTKLQGCVYDRLQVQGCVYVCHFANACTWSFCESCASFFLIFFLKCIEPICTLMMSVCI